MSNIRRRKPDLPQYHEDYQGNGIPLWMFALIVTAGIAYLVYKWMIGGL